MDKKTLVIAIAIATIVITTLIQFFIRGRDLSPATRRLLWLSFAAGIVALIITSIVSLTG